MKRVELSHLYNVGWFLQNGAIVLSQSGPVTVNMCGRHREYYDGRMAERKRRHPEFFEMSIPM